ncbi:MAG: DoxX family protein [Pseudomonadota bacterium]
MNFLNPIKDISYALFRIVTGFLFLCHGTQKLFNLPIEYPYGPLNVMTTSAGVIELVAGTMVMVGFFARPAAFLCSGTMAVAYWMVHGLNYPFPIGNGGELAALYCFAFLYIAANGTGVWSINKH